MKKNYRKQTANRAKEIKIENNAPPVVKWPDSDARRKKIFGDRALNPVRISSNLATAMGSRPPLRPKPGVRTLASLHMVAQWNSRLIDSGRCWTSDERQAKLAKAQGMKTA